MTKDKSKHGDSRLEKRGPHLYQKMVKCQSAVINQISSERKELVEMCRFINNDKVKLKALMENNRQDCAHKIDKGKSYLVLHDTSDLNFYSHSGKLKVRDVHLGPIGSKTDKGVGFLIHPSLVIDRATGFPTGYSQIKIWNRQFGQSDRLERKYESQKVEEKESYKWIEAVQASSWLCDQSNHVTHVMDRDADMYELLIQPRSDNEDYLIRSCQDRCLFDQHIRLKGYMSEQRLSCSFTLKIIGNDHRRSREAKLGLKYKRIKIKKPANGLKSLPEYIEVNVVVVEEYADSVPPGDTAIKWVLYTTHEVNNIEDAFQIVEWYRMRWIIEELFATFKTRCLRIEDSQLETGIGLKKLTVIALQAALQILQLVKDRDNKYAEKASLIFSPQAIVFLKVLTKVLEGKTEKQKIHLKKTL